MFQRISRLIRQVPERNDHERRDSPRFNIPLYVRTGTRFVERFGRLSINGFYFETNENLMLGQSVEIKVVLLGLGMEVHAQGKVIQLDPTGNHVNVAARFDDIPFETERMIARWLDLMSDATEHSLAN